MKRQRKTTKAEVNAEVKAIKKQKEFEEIDFLSVPAIKKAIDKCTTDAQRAAWAQMVNDACDDLEDARFMQEIYLSVNDEPLTQKIVDKAMKAASKLDAPSKIKTCWIDYEGQELSCKDVYRIAMEYLGYGMTNKDFTTHDAIDELKFFVRINWNVDGREGVAMKHPRSLATEAQVAKAEGVEVEYVDAE